MARILRGDIYWIEFDPTVGHEQAGLRPGLILSADVFNERSKTVIAVAVTSQQPSVGFPLAVALTGTRLPKQSWVKVGQIRTLSTQRLKGKLGRASAEDIQAVIDGLNEIIG